MSKKAFLLFAALVAPGAIRAENPMLGGFRNSIKFDAVAFIDQYDPKVQNYMASYSQPNSFFRLPGRRNIHAGYINGRTNYQAVPQSGYHRSVKIRREETTQDISQMVLGLSQDVSLLDIGGFYTGLGIGPFIKEFGRGFVGSQFMFGERFFIGYRFERFGAELVALHYSNGHLTEMNNGLDGFGLGIHWNF
ncbi:MAG: acyloxyacyl hydrolase [Rickettsiales bacterium]|jgi:hypothetical protein|nr:acyloxyacyl hydrolase [Rickettsiales bacterium]